MSEHDFTSLFDAYPSIIESMDNTFTSHEFIRRLAQENQIAYIEALHVYCDRERDGTSTPFQMVHGILAQHLQTLPNLVTKIGDTNSTDIFGQSNSCAEWQKV